ncbi:MAG: hypothetical protein RL540_486, partial [Actinomycetota bacterium]
MLVHCDYSFEVVLLEDQEFQQLFLLQF